MNSDDPLWPHFAPLWRDLRSEGHASMAVAGGYGLFMKQEFIKVHSETATIIPLSQWKDATSRVTKDVDIVLGLDIISDKEEQGRFVEVLHKHEYCATPENPRWQFRKTISESHSVIVEFHAQRPSLNIPNLRVGDYRVKHKPSLGPGGVHGRLNPEAVGCELQPFPISIDGLEFLLPNPVTWTMMKLAAMNNYWMESQDTSRTDDSRDLARSQAFKHANDVGRIVALVTRDERDHCTEVVDAIGKTEEFSQAAEILQEMGGNTTPLMAQWENIWEAEDLLVIKQTLDGWYSFS